MLHKKSVSLTHSLLPLKFYYHKLSAGIFLCLCVFIAFSAYKDPSYASRMRAAMLDVTTPIITVFAKPAEAISGAVDGVRELAFLRKENAALKEQNRILLRWQSVALGALTENESLRKLARYNENASAFFISSRLVSETGGAFSRTGIISSGSRDGVVPGMAVINESGLVGKVSTSAVASAKVTLLTDINSRIPVISAESGEKFIAAGNNTNNLDMIYLPEHSKTASGEKVMTSGDGGVFPSGILVGTVRQLDGGKMAIVPETDISSVTLVGVVNYTRE